MTQNECETGCEAGEGLCFTIQFIYNQWIILYGEGVNIEMGKKSLGGSLGASWRKCHGMWIFKSIMRLIDGCKKGGVDLIYK